MLDSYYMPISSDHHPEKSVYRVTILFFLILNDQEAMFCLLLENGFDPNKKIEDELSLLEYCVQFDKIKYLKLLLQYGMRIFEDITQSLFQIQLTDDIKMNGFEFFKKQFNVIRKKNLQYKGKSNSLSSFHSAIYLQKLECVAVFLDYHADVYKENLMALDALGMAVCCEGAKESGGGIEIVKLILASGGNPNKIYEVNGKYLSPFNTACGKGWVKFAELMLEYKANVTQALPVAFQLKNIADELCYSETMHLSAYAHAYLCRQKSIVDLIDRLSPCNIINKAYTCAYLNIYFLATKVAPMLNLYVGKDIIYFKANDAYADLELYQQCIKACAQVDTKKYNALSKELYGKGITNYKKKNYLSAAIYFTQCFILSKYSLRQS